MVRVIFEEARRGCFFCSISPEESQLAGRDGCRDAYRDTCHHTTLGCEWASRSDELTARTIAVGRKMQAYLRKTKRVERFACYFDCFVPQGLELDGGWRRRRGVRCRYNEVVIGAVARVARSDDTKGKTEELYRKLGFDGDETEGEEVWEWFGKRFSWGLTDAINLCRVFTHMYVDLD